MLSLRALGLTIAVVLAIAPAAPAQQPSRCDAATKLLDAGQTAAAKAQYTKALEDPAQRGCAVAGLVAVGVKQDKAAAEDNRLQLGEAWDATVDWTLGTAWPWVLAVLAVCVLIMIFRALSGPNRVLVSATKDHEQFAKSVAAAANAAGGTTAAPAKIVVGGAGNVPAGTSVDVAKLLNVPGTAPLGELFKLPSLLPHFLPRFTVESAVAGGWAVVDMSLSWPVHSKRTARLALPLGSLDDEEQSAVLALAAGAWLGAVLQVAGNADGRAAAGSDDSLCAHACFRAGANQHAIDNVDVARACYAAMPEVDCDEAPFAWAGAHLNQIMALKNEHRWSEAVHMADQIGDFPEDLIDSDAGRFYSRAELEDLRLRTCYLLAIVHVDHFYTNRDDTALRTKAELAVDAANKTALHTPIREHDTATLKLAIKVVALCFKIVVGECKNLDLDDVRAALTLDGFTSRVARPAISAAAYYDAACAVSMLLEKLNPHTPNYHVQFTEYRDEGLRLLDLAVRATTVSAQPRVRTMAKADPMLDPLERIARVRFAQALGDGETPAKAAAVAG